MPLCQGSVCGKDSLLALDTSTDRWDEPSPGGSGRNPTSTPQRPFKLSAADSGPSFLLALGVLPGGPLDDAGPRINPNGWEFSGQNVITSRPPPSINFSILISSSSGRESQSWREAARCKYALPSGNSLSVLKSRWSDRLGNCSRLS